MSYCWDRDGFAELDTETRQWRAINIACDREPPEAACYVYSQEGVFICGGFEEVTLARVFFLDGKSISLQKPMLQSRMDACGLLHGKSLYMFGGFNRESELCLPTCERLSLDTGKWSPFPAMSFGRRNASACILIDTIYIFGGENLAEVEFFAFEEGKWTTADFILPIEVQAAALCPLDEVSVLLLGGRRSDKGLSRAVLRIDVNADLVLREEEMDAGVAVTQPAVVRQQTVILISGRDLIEYRVKPKARRAPRLSTDPGKTEIRLDQASPMLSRELASIGIMGLSPAEQTVTISLPEKPLVLVVKRRGFDEDISRCFQSVISELLQRNVKVLVERSVQEALPSEVRVFDLRDHNGKVNLLVTLGGDGTVIWAVSLFKAEPLPPILAMHMGSLGFMTYYSVEEGMSVLRVCLQRKGIAVDLKKRLEIWTTLQSGKKTLKGTALNEVVIDRGSVASLLHVDCYMDDDFFTTAYADGVMIATPAGSTAYSLAAGGSIVHPEIPCMLFTPISPHSLSFRPILFPENVVLSFEVPNDARCCGMVSIDGSSRFELPKKVRLEVRISSYPVAFISEGKGLTHWMRQLTSTMKWNKRKKQKPLVLSSPANGSTE